MAAASGFATSLSSTNSNIHSETQLKVDLCSNGLRARNPSYCSVACFPPRNSRNNLRRKAAIPERKLFGLNPRCEVASDAEIRSKTSSLSALELLKTSAADRKFHFLPLD